jgi:hypothetical protein
MRRFYRFAAAVGLALALTASAGAQEKAKKGSGDAAIAAALENAMTPGPGQKKLDFMVGTFDVKIRTWTAPTDAPTEDAAVTVASWVLGGRYVQLMLAGTIGGEPYNGIGYAGFDNTTKKYVATFIDSASTGMEWYQGGFDATGKNAVLKGSVANPVTAKPSLLEMRLTIDAAGNHVTELWGYGLGDKLFKLMELTYIKRKP